MKQKEIKSYIEKGYLRIRVIFEIIGRPKEHVEKTLKAYIEHIKTDKEVIILNEDYEPANEVEEGMFAVIAETEMLLENIEKVSWLAVNFSPASIELIEPDALTMQQREVSHWINDMLARLHEIGVMQKSLNSQVQGINRNFNSMTRNAIILCLEQEPRDIEYIGKRIGMSKEHTEKFIEALIKEKKITKDKTKYKLLR